MGGTAPAGTIRRGPPAGVPSTEMLGHVLHRGDRVLHAGEDWYAEDVAEHMGIAVSGVRTTLIRLGVRPYRHEPLPGGGVRAVYSAAAVRAAHAARPGRGARTDLQEQP